MRKQIFNKTPTPHNYDATTTKPQERVHENIQIYICSKIKLYEHNEFQL